MAAFIAENWGTLLVCLVVAGIIAAAVLKLARDKRQGKCPGCDSSCGTCPGRTKR